MSPNLAKILTIFLLFSYLSASSQEIWFERFLVPEKGIWGDENGQIIHSDFEGISTWALEYSAVSLSSPEDYAKTVSTSGGRFECRDINAEVVWRSEVIDISAYKNVKIQLEAKETGSGANEKNKYLKACFIANNSNEILFENNGTNKGNWGQTTAEQTKINAETLQLVIYMNNHYANDKVILDEIVVSGEEKNPVVINPGEVLLNEVLFNPVPDGEDFIEIYNHSQKAIPINKLYLASRDKDLELTQVYALSSEKELFEPETYLALTKDTNAVFPWFTIECPKCFVQMNKFPSYNNDEDYVVLLNAEMEIIDELSYNEKMHAPLLHNREGISLERIAFSEPTNDKSNWYSASSLAGYGTPGYKNSQFNEEKKQKAQVSFKPEAFSPNNDNYKDFYTIDFQLDKPGYICNVWIYNTSGQVIRKLANNNILGTNEQIIWNGKDENGQRLKIGPYIVLVEIFNTDGFVKQYKDGVVLTDILE